MRINQRGLAIPFVLLLVGLTALAIELAIPNEALSSAQQMRFKHATWWHWQRAVAHFYHRTGLWPNSMHEVAEHFNLTSPPDFIVGYPEGNGFRIRCRGLTLYEAKTLKKALFPHIEPSTQNSIDVVLSAKEFGTEEPQMFVSRFESTPLEVSIDLNNFNFGEVNRFQATEATFIIGTAGVAIRELEADKVVAEQITVGQSIQVDRLSSLTEVDILERLTFDIQMLYAALDDYMSSDEQYSSHPYPSTVSVHCASRECFQLDEFQGAIPLLQVNGR